MKRKYLLSIPIFIFGLCVNVNEIKAGKGTIISDADANQKVAGSTSTCHGYKDCFPNVDSNNNIRTGNVYKDKDGNVIAYYTDDPEFKKTLIENGIDPNLIKSSGDFSVNLPKGSIESKEEATAQKWKEFYDTINSDFTYIDDEGNYRINPDSLAYKLGTDLGLYSGDPDADSENLWNGNTTGFYIETVVYIKSDGIGKIADSSTISEVCRKYINNTSNTNAGEHGAYCRAVRDSNGVFTDDGWIESTSCYERERKNCKDCSPRTIHGICCKETSGDADEYGTCCMYFHSPEECNSGDTAADDDDDDDDDDVPPTPTECPYDPVEPIEYPHLTPKTPSVSPATCGGVYTYVDYSYETNECNVIFETQKTVTIRLAALGGYTIKYAGESFDWNQITSKQETTTRVFDTSYLATEISEVQATVTNTNKLIEQLKCLNDKDAKTIQDIENEKQGLSVETSCGNLTGSDRANCEKGVTDAISGKNEAITNLQQAINARNTQIDTALASQEYLNAVSRLETLNNCMTAANNYRNTTHSSTNVARVDQEYMVLKNLNDETIYTANKGEYVAINKNSGLPLTGAELTEEIVNSGAYLTLASDFYIPTNIPLSAKGTVTRNISFDSINTGRKSTSYSCDLGATNLSICEDPPCLENSINIIYRPISLSNPFPNSSGVSSQYRKLGDNWSNELVNQYIKNNRNVSDYDVYNLTPLYTITLTPAKIKEIRTYNKSHSYNDFNLTCEDGYNCLSKFLWEEFDGIVDTSRSCASSSGLDTNCYNGGVSE